MPSIFTLFSSDFFLRTALLLLPLYCHSLLLLLIYFNVYNLFPGTNDNFNFISCRI